MPKKGPDSDSDLTESFEPVIGTAVTLRPLRREDRDIESAFVQGLSAETRYNRLLGGAIAITNTHSVGVVHDALIAAATQSRGASNVWSLPIVGEG